jgi:hypothetical protein
MALRTLIAALLAVILATAGPAQTSQTHKKKDNYITNYDGGMTILTDGSFADGPCFRLNGLVTAPSFFDELKRIDTISGTFFRNNHDIVTEFPEKLEMTLKIRDYPCTDALQQNGPHPYLTQDMVRSLRMVVLWKRGIAVRPANGVKVLGMETREVVPYAKELADKLPQRFEWLLEFEVPSEGIPLTDSLVIILRTSLDKHIAARAAARL